MSVDAKDILALLDNMVDEDKSTEYIIQFITDFYSVDYGTVVSVVVKNRLHERRERP